MRTLSGLQTAAFSLCLHMVEREEGESLLLVLRSHQSCQVRAPPLRSHLALPPQDPLYKYSHTGGLGLPYMDYRGTQLVPSSGVGVVVCKWLPRVSSCPPSTVKWIYSCFSGKQKNSFDFSVLANGT